MRKNKRMITRPEPFSISTDQTFAGKQNKTKSSEHLEKSTQWIQEVIHLNENSQVLLIGENTQEYVELFSAKGIKSARVSVEEVEFGAEHTAVVIIGEAYSSLSPIERADLLTRVHTSLKSDGYIIFDCAAAPRFAKIKEDTQLLDGTTREVLTYPDLSLVLDRYTDESGCSRSIWTHCITPTKARAELVASGFNSPDLHGNLVGDWFNPMADTFVAISRRL